MIFLLPPFANGLLRAQHTYLTYCLAAQLAAAVLYKNKNNVHPQQLSLQLVDVHGSAVLCLFVMRQKWRAALPRLIKSLLQDCHKFLRVESWRRTSVAPQINIICMQCRSWLTVIYVYNTQSYRQHRARCRYVDMYD